MFQAPEQPIATPFQPGALPVETPFTTISPTPSSLPESSAAEANLYLPLVAQTSQTLWIDPALPSALRSVVALPPDTGVAQFADKAVLRLEVSAEQPISRWVYALVTPFPTMIEGVSPDDLSAAWNGQASGPFAGKPILLDENTLAVFSKLWGAPADGAVQVALADELLGIAWDRRSAWALLPFEALEPRWKVLEVDGQSPLRKGFDNTRYPLAAPVSLLGDPVQVQEVIARYGPGTQLPLLPSSNRDPNKLTVLAMTGVTALVRATAYTMEQRGILYPGKDIGPWLREADITHISNEVPFAENCPPPNPVQEGMRFCSDDRYIALMEDMGTDVVELTGDHFQDWGQAAMYHTLELYRQRGWGYYGGGENLQDGRKALLLEHNGNRIAFIGCNGKGGPYAQASDKRPGAVTCDFKWMEAEIARLRSEGYLPVATFQHFEYYTYRAQPDQIRDFRALAKAGAVIVSGSQAHQPQAMEFLGSSFIHYGLGNLFFDQYDVSPATRQGFIDRHIFYDGRYIGTELLTIEFVDYARPRSMTTGERQDVLTKVFKASGW
jgi:Bacterial capsule synthesis protein PGA_cap